VGNGGEFSMFTGEFEYRVDEKGRVPIPPKFRTDELKKDGVVLCPGIEKCITVYPSSEWKKIAASLTSSSAIIPSKMRKLNRAIFATSFTLEFDGQGRIVIPVQLRHFAGIEDEVVVAGLNSYFEIWDKQRWESKKTACQEEAWQIIESMEPR
jgi:MraZ protein